MTNGNGGKKNKACGNLLISRKQTTKFSLINALPLLLASNLGILH